MAAQTRIDVDGTEAVSTVLLNLLNTFPGLSEGKRIRFSTVGPDEGIGFFPVSGAVFLKNKESITGHVTQECQYPFSILYCAAPKTEKQRLRIKEFLDTLGKWLELQSVTVDGESVRLDGYPPLDAGNRKITAIARINAAHLNAAYENGVEDWGFSAALTYRNEYDKPD